MGREKRENGGTRDRILDAALELFLEKGYEETAVRMILERSGAVAGSFYHYFGSKEALFEACIERFLQRYAEQISAIAKDDTNSFDDSLDALLAACEQGIQSYFGGLGADRVHWTIQYALHVRTLQSMLPAIQHMVEKALDNGTAENPLGLDPPALAAVVLHGIEGILHARPLETVGGEEIVRLKEKSVEYVALILGIER